MSLIQSYNMSLTFELFNARLPQETVQDSRVTGNARVLQKGQIPSKRSGTTMKQPKPIIGSLQSRIVVLSCSLMFSHVLSQCSKQRSKQPIFLTYRNHFCSCRKDRDAAPLHRTSLALPKNRAGRTSALPGAPWARQL